LKTDFEIQYFQYRVETLIWPRKWTLTGVQRHEWFVRKSKTAGRLSRTYISVPTADKTMMSINHTGEIAPNCKIVGSKSW